MKQRCGTETFHPRHAWRNAAAARQAAVAPGGSGIDGKGSYLDGAAAADGAAGQVAAPGGSGIDGKGSYLDGEAAAEGAAGQAGNFSPRRAV